MDSHQADRGSRRNDSEDDDLARAAVRNDGHLAPLDRSGNEEESAEEEEPAAAEVVCGRSRADAWLGRLLLASTFAATPATSAVFLSPTAETSDNTETAPAAPVSRSSGVMPLTLCAGVEEACFKASHS